MTPELLLEESPNPLQFSKEKGAQIILEFWQCYQKCNARSYVSFMFHVLSLSFIDIYRFQGFQVGSTAQIFMTCDQITTLQLSFTKLSPATWSIMRWCESWCRDLRPRSHCLRIFFAENLPVLSVLPYTLTKFGWNYELLASSSCCDSCAVWSARGFTASHGVQSRPSRLCRSHSPGLAALLSLAQPCSALVISCPGGSLQLVLPPGTKQGTAGPGTARATARYCQGKQCKVSNVKRCKEYQECTKKHVEQDKTAALVKESAPRDLFFCNLCGVSVESPAFWSCIVDLSRSIFLSRTDVKTVAFQTQRRVVGLSLDWSALNTNIATSLQWYASDYDYDYYCCCCCYYYSSCCCCCSVLYPLVNHLRNDIAGTTIHHFLLIRDLPWSTNKLTPRHWIWIYIPWSKALNELDMCKMRQPPRSSSMRKKRPGGFRWMSSRCNMHEIRRARGANPLPKEYRRNEGWRMVQEPGLAGLSPDTTEMEPSKTWMMEQKFVVFWKHVSSCAMCHHVSSYVKFQFLLSFFPEAANCPLSVLFLFHHSLALPWRLLKAFFFTEPNYILHNLT